MRYIIEIFRLMDNKNHSAKHSNILSGMYNILCNLIVAYKNSKININYEFLDVFITTKYVETNQRFNDVLRDLYNQLLVRRNFARQGKASEKLKYFIDFFVKLLYRFFILIPPINHFSSKTTESTSNLSITTTIQRP